jgi:uncharacterized membrane protein
LWQDDRLVDLGALLGDGSAGAQDINNRGQIVGTYDGRAGACPTACVTGRDPRVRDPVSWARKDHDHDYDVFWFS